MSIKEIYVCKELAPVKTIDRPKEAHYWCIGISFLAVSIATTDTTTKTKSVNKFFVIEKEGAIFEDFQDDFIESENRKFDTVVKVLVFIALLVLVFLFSVWAINRFLVSINW
jgi:hypothetical protein